MSTNLSSGPSGSGDLLPGSSTMTTTSIPVRFKNPAHLPSWSSNSHFTSDIPIILDDKTCSDEQLSATPTDREAYKNAAAANSDKRNFLKFSKEYACDNKQAITKHLGRHSTHHKITTIESLGPSIMFSSLFDVGTNIVSTPITSTQRHSPSVSPTHTETEQVPAYSTSTHAAWFSNPANKIVRGVSMGVSRSVAELQQVGRTATTGLNAKAHENASTATHGQSDNVLDYMGTLAGFGKADSPHPDPVSNHLHIPFSGKTADLDDISIDPLTDYAMLQGKEKSSATKPIFDISGDDLDNEEDDTSACEASASPTRMFHQNRGSSSATSITISTLGSSNTSLSSINFHVENTAPDAESICGLDNTTLDSEGASPD